MTNGVIIVIGRLARLAGAFWHDTRGTILPYASIVLAVIVGMSVLALDGARFMSLQTQLQQGADALALAGAAELDRASDSITRANAAINNLVTNRTWYGSGTDVNVRVSSIRYLSSLPASDASAISATNVTTDPASARFVEVTVAPVILSNILPASFFGGTDSMSTTASSVAGFADEVVCDFAPVFVCNPYETSGMTDAQATAALNAALNPAPTTPGQYRLDITSTLGPGHFGYLIPPDGCTGASCLEQWIAATRPKACFAKSGVDLNMGMKTSVQNGFNVRFDLYNGGNPLNTPSSTYAPGINVRKGYLPTHTGDWCTASQASPYFTTPVVTVTGNTQSGNNTAKKTIVGMSSTSGLVVGNPIADPGNVYIPAGTTIASIVSSTSITISNAAISAHTGVSLTSKGITSGLPEDKQFTGNQGNGNWNCASYWSINHPGVAAPTGCTDSNPTISRYAVYRYEITHGRTGDWSGNGLTNMKSSSPTTNSATASGNNTLHFASTLGIAVGMTIADTTSPTAIPSGTTVLSTTTTTVVMSKNASGNITSGSTISFTSTGTGESGAPYCAASAGVTGVDVTTGVTDRRLIFPAVINCLAQASTIGGGSTANNVPVAGFAKYFMSQPAGADAANPNSLFGEMIGLVDLNDNVRILNQVQLYR